MAEMSEDQEQRLTDLLHSPAPDVIEIVDRSGFSYSVCDIVLETSQGFSDTRTVLRIVIDEKEE